MEGNLIMNYPQLNQLVPHKYLNSNHMKHDNNLYINHSKVNSHRQSIHQRKSTLINHLLNKDMLT